MIASHHGTYGHPAVSCYEYGLIVPYLRDDGYKDSVKKLRKELQVNQAADNSKAEKTREKVLVTSALIPHPSAGSAAGKHQTAFRDRQTDFISFHMTAQRLGKGRVQHIGKNCGL